MKSSRRTQSVFSTVLSTPRYLTLHPVGIDISPKAVRVMQLKHTRGGLIPDVFKEYELEEACELLETREDLKTCESLRTALAQVKKELGVTYATISLPELKTYIFKTSVPPEALPTIEDALLVRLQENVPLEPQEVLFDFKILPKEKYQQLVDVVVTAFPKSVLETYTALLHEVGIIPILFESESQASARAVLAPDDMSPYLLMNFGHTNINIAIVERGEVHYTSSIPYTSQEIVADFNAQPAQAFKTKVNKLLVYWFTNKQHIATDEKISNVILTGPFASASGLVSFLEKHLRLNVETANVWQNCFDINQRVPDMSYEESLRYSTAIGVTLRNR